MQSTVSGSCTPDTLFGCAQPLSNSVSGQPLKSSGADLLLGVRNGSVQTEQDLSLKNSVPPDVSLLAYMTCIHDLRAYKGIDISTLKNSLLTQHVKTD